MKSLIKLSFYAGLLLASSVTLSGCGRFFVRVVAPQIKDAHTCIDARQKLAEYNEIEATVGQEAADRFAEHSWWHMESIRNKVETCV